MADRALVAAIAAAGIPTEDAEDMVTRVGAAALTLLLAGKSVRLDGIGTLTAPLKVASAGFPPGHLRQQRRAALRGSIIEKGEPYVPA